MKRSIIAILATIIVIEILTSCSTFTYSYSYDNVYGNYEQEEIVADTSKWWLKPIYIRTNDTVHPDSMEMRNFVWFHDDDSQMTYVKVSADNSILFEPRQTDIDLTGLKELIYIGKLLENKPFSQLIIYGSTDDTESRDYSIELSNERAEVVAEFFERMGYNPDAIQVIGLGDTDPAASNSTIEGRALNRYVDVFVTIAD